MKITLFFKRVTIAVAVSGMAVTSQAVDFHVSTAQGFQNALTAAQGNGANNNIWLTNGYYTGTFSYNSASANTLSVMAEPNLTNGQVAIDPEAGGVGLNINCTAASGNVTVSNITFIRNTGSSSLGALRVAASSGGSTTVNGCQFFSPNTTDQGMGLAVASGLNTTIFNCNVNGKTNGSAADGDGINISSVTGTTLMYSNTVANNYGGDGADITASAIMIASNNVFSGNSYNGFYFNPATGSKIAQVLVTNNVFNANSTNAHNYWGAYIQNFGTLTLAGNIFSGNTLGNAAGANTGNGVSIFGNTFNQNGYYNGYYGGLAVYSVLTSVISGNLFNANQGGYGGGALYCNTVYTNLVTGNTFTGNANDSGSGGGAACFLNLSTGNLCTVSNNTFSANSINGPGGACAFSGGGATVTVANNTFTGNSSTGNYGGGAVYLYGSTNFINANTFLQNSSSYGGGAIDAVGPVVNLTLTDNLIVNNTQSGSGSLGGGLYANVSGVLYMVNNTVFNNTSGGGGGGAAFVVGASGARLNVFNNIIWGNSATGNGADVYLSGAGASELFMYNDANAMYGVWNNTLPLTNASPSFFNPINGTTTGDYHLQTNSPCLNYGTNGPFLALTDLDGNNRTNSAGQVDLGCYQFNNKAVHPADTNGTFVITASEYATYAVAWKAGLPWTTAPTNAPNPIPIPANYVTRAGYIMTNGGSYYNDGSARPTNWKTNAP